MINDPKNIISYFLQNRLLYFKQKYLKFASLTVSFETLLFSCRVIFQVVGDNFV